jgi:HPt (histidine-containing phosphotransfer) domain-containing protein
MENRAIPIFPLDDEEIAHLNIASRKPDPVVSEGLREFAEGYPKTYRRLMARRLHETATLIEQIRAAIRAGSGREVEHLAHSGAGSSTTFGFVALVPLFREMERLGRAGRLAEAVPCGQQLGQEFVRVERFLQAEPVGLYPSLG